MAAKTKTLDGIQSGYPMVITTNTYLFHLLYGSTVVIYCIRAPLNFIYFDCCVAKKFVD